MNFQFLLNPAFYDIFGMIIFAFIIALFIWALHTKKKIPIWARRTMLGIGIAGLITDICMVYFHFMA